MKLSDMLCHGSVFRPRRVRRLAEMVKTKADRKHDQRCNRGQCGDGTQVPRPRSYWSFNFAREDHAFGSSPVKEPLPRTGQRFRRDLPQFLPESSLGLRQLLGDETRQLLVVRKAFATFLQMSLEINQLRTLQKAAGSKGT